MKTCQRLIEKVKQESELSRLCDQLLTDALTSMEKQDYAAALRYADTCRILSPWIEQRCACIAVMTTAAAKSKKATANFLAMIYCEQGGVANA